MVVSRRQDQFNQLGGGDVAGSRGTKAILLTMDVVGRLVTDYVINQCSTMRGTVHYFRPKDVLRSDYHYESVVNYTVIDWLLRGLQEKGYLDWIQSSGNKVRGYYVLHRRGELCRAAKRDRQEVSKIIDAIINEE